MYDRFTFWLMLFSGVAMWLLMAWATYETYSSGEMPPLPF